MTARRAAGRGAAASLVAAFFVAGTLLVPSASFGAAGGAGGAGGAGLDHLFIPGGGALVQYSSHAPKPGAVDSWEVPAGATVTLVDHHGPGVVRRWWMTIIQTETNADLFRRSILRCYWDGETTPSVEAPLADFFGLSFGEVHDFTSSAVSVTSGGLNCYWPMPFRSSARITLENQTGVPISGLFFNIAVEKSPKVPRDALYFHAQFRSAPTVQGKPVVVLETSGAGNYVGTVMSARTLRGVGMRFLEGNERIFVDGEREPSVAGTGTEDYFGGGLYFVTGAFSGPYLGVTVLDREKNRVGAYRWHILDPIRFTKSLRFELQHGPNDDVPSEYATLAVWYQTHPHSPFPPFPEGGEAVGTVAPFRIEGAIEGEELVGSALATQGRVTVQSMAEFHGDWSGDAQLLWRGGSPGGHLTLFVTSPEAGEREVIGHFTKSGDYGDVKVMHQGRELAVIRGYAPGIATSTVSLGRVLLERGPNAFLLEIEGKDARSNGYAVGIDGFAFKP
jgi:hypothetical protein